MTALDLTEPVETAAEYLFGIEAARLDAAPQAWDDAKPAVKHVYRKSVLGPIAAAAPLIEAQVRAQVIAEIEAEDIRLRSSRPSGEWNPWHDGLMRARRLIRGAS